METNYSFTPSSRKRHVKCDETKPSCLNCMKWRGYCDGFAEASKTPSAATTKSKARQSRDPNANAKLIHTKKAPLILTEPAINTIHFLDADQRAYFDEWSRLSVTFLSGGVSQSRLWTTTMPQLTLQEKTLRYGAMAVGALRKAQESSHITPTMAVTQENRHYLNAISYYCAAMQMQSAADVNKDTLRTALLSSLLFICFEAQRGNVPAALKHVTHGFSLLNELAACTQKAPDIVSIAPAPPALVEEILDCYKPLELQSRSFMGSYKRFFFAGGGGKGGPPSSQPTPGGASPSSSSSSAQTPPSHPGSPWRGQQQQQPPPPPGTQQGPTGLPSPQSQGSPQSQAGPPSSTSPNPNLTPGSGPSSTPTNANPIPGRGPPQRPPGIAPFTRHSPYFRPKHSHITTLEEIPPMFKRFDEAHGYWSLLQRNMVQYIPLLTVTTAQLALNKVTDWKELAMKLGSIRQNPKIAKFIDESRYWLQRWIHAFDMMWRSAIANRQQHPRAFLHAASLRIEYLILYIYTSIPRFSSLETAVALSPQYREMTTLCEALIASRPSCGFAMDSGWTWPLFVASFGCRDPAIREDAIRVLGQYPTRNALRDSRVFRAIALKNRDVEAANALEDDVHTQWLRLRRRELVFEDFGASIIFRSAQKDAVTGRWELVEEVADFAVHVDGTLDWKRQPISESASILSGVC